LGHLGASEVDAKAEIGHSELSGYSPEKIEIKRDVLAYY
jgi:hypothetical protein